VTAMFDDPQRGQQRCRVCGVVRPLGDFYPEHRRCKTCVKQAYDPGHQRSNILRNKHGLTPEAFDALLAAQDYRCAICRSDEPGGKGTWHIDHDHRCCPTARSCTRCRRGLLCDRCNWGLGLFLDDPGILRRAIDYLAERAMDVYA
jgi:recombination endonuclease VII